MSESITPAELTKWLEVCEKATPGSWQSWRDGNQYLNGEYGQKYSTEFSNENCVGASIVKGLPRAWNPFYVQDATELENVSRFKDEDADFIALARTGWPRTIRALQAANERVAELEAEARVPPAAQVDTPKKSVTPLLQKIVEICDAGSALEFNDADERLRAIRGLIIGEAV